MDKQFEQLTQLIKENGKRTDDRIDGLAERTGGRFEEIKEIVSRTSGRVEELTLEVRDLRKTLLATNEKIDVLHGEVTGSLVRESKRVTALENRVDILEGQAY